MKCLIRSKEVYVIEQTEENLKSHHSQMNKYLTFCNVQGLFLLMYMENKCGKYDNFPSLDGLLCYCTMNDYHDFLLKWSICQWKCWQFSTSF